MKEKRLGIDIGSTTVKGVVIDHTDKVVYSAYSRHNARIIDSLREMLIEIINKNGDQHMHLALSGSTGMGIAESTGIPFIQEVVAASTLAKIKYPGVKSLIDIGGEDAKLVLFDDRKKPDIRMNGSCAGGTGAYIDQMATLLDVPISALNEMAHKAKNTFPIASRCGVFAKTDVQNLISRKISLEEVAASIFEAVASQIINSLARGCTINSPLLFCGGPLTYLSYLRKVIQRQLNIDHQDTVLPPSAELFTASGAALNCHDLQTSVLLSNFLKKLSINQKTNLKENGLKPLFTDNSDLITWNNERRIIKIPHKKPDNKETCFLGIDSGSTTAKIVVINEQAEVLYQFYKNNNGRSLETIVEGLNIFQQQLKKEGKTVSIQGSAVTGYGEDLIRTALNIDHGIVETVSHLIAAQKLEPKVTFVLDIGGQDMKAIFVQNNTVTNIEINEACSSGCGSFIENFACTLGYNISDFTELALLSENPYNLGSRCTVFMNSKVKQALREGASIKDLSSGLAYSVIRNCLYKVLKIKNGADIGDYIVVQGGTFRNKAVYRALEVLSEKKIISSDIPELMGAYGAALYALDNSDESQAGLYSCLDNPEEVHGYTTRTTACKGCTNKCMITIYKFNNGQKCFTGNKCEKMFSNSASTMHKGENIFEYKKQVLFNKITRDSSKKIHIGIPRILNLYENYPFWYTLFTECGLEVILSDDSTNELYKKGTGYIMSDNICFPAKLSSGHIINLIEKNVDRIFFPFVIYEKKEFRNSSNSFNCPIVSAYSEILKNPSELSKTHKIPFDSPGINFNDEKLLKKACLKYISQFGINKSRITLAFKTALEKQDEFKQKIKQKNEEILNTAIENNQLVVLVASHPYHIDPLIHHQASQILSGLGVSVINEEIASDKEEGFSQYFTISQWEYPNRILQAAWWVCKQKYPIGLIQLNSFGCGPDSFIMDEINDLSKKHNVPYALIRIDEITSTGSLKLRLRSLVESLKLREKTSKQKKNNLSENRIAIFNKSDKRKTILVPWFSDFYSPFLPVLGKIAGYKVVNLPPADSESADLGLIYANNEICYPATLVVGDIIKALRSNQYDLNDIAVGISQTGGQCRATNYLSLIKRAMVKAGYDYIPVIAIAPSEGLHNTQPGFSLNWKKLLVPAFFGLLFIDSLARLYYATVSREKYKHDSDNLRNIYINKAKILIENNECQSLYNLLKQAINDFNNIKVTTEDIPTVGVVGEIYIKYNSYGQYDIINWLIDNKVEVVIPPLYEFMTQAFINGRAMKSSLITKRSGMNIINMFLEWEAEHHIARYEKLLGNFRFYRPVHSIRETSRYASEIISLMNQYGEGWLIPGEIASFARQNINDVICMQPFGCIANHVVGKGIEKKIKEKYPNLNLLFLDFDYGTSKVNLLNRLHFLIQNQESYI